MKRSTPLKRTGFAPKVKPLPGILRTAKPTPAKPTLAAKPRTRKCKICRTPFVPRNPMRDKWCSPECGAVLAQRLVAANHAKAAKRERAETQRRKQALKTIPQLIAEAQVAFNAYVRFRDRNQPCICCDSWGGTEALTGGKWDCGHYRSRGSAGHLRFDERNAHRQLKDCNRHGAGRAVDYRIGLIRRIGREAVEALEADQAIVKWTREDLIAIKAEYRAKLKELKAIAQGEEQC